MGLPTGSISRHFRHTGRRYAKPENVSQAIYEKRSEEIHRPQEMDIGMLVKCLSCLHPVKSTIYQQVSQFSSPPQRLSPQRGSLLCVSLPLLLINTGSQITELNKRQDVQMHRPPHCLGMNNTLRLQSPNWAQWTGDQQLLNSSCPPPSFGGNIVQTNNPVYSCAALGDLGEALCLPFLSEVSHMH
jgi:hypothetical protein